MPTARMICSQRAIESQWWHMADFTGIAILHLAQDGRISVALAPQLPRPAAPRNGRAIADGEASHAVRLSLDLSGLDAETVLLQAAAANAGIRLGAC